MQERNVTDPVCGLEVNPRDARFTSTYQGKTYYFTDPDCKRMFDEDPTAYVAAGMSQGKAPKTYTGGRPSGPRK